MDCAIHIGSNAKEGIACYSFGNAPPSNFSYKPSYSNEEKEKITKINRKVIKWKGYKIKLEGIDRIVKPYNKSNKKLGEIYDYDSYMAAKKNIEINPILIGRTEVNPKDPRKARFLKVGDLEF